MRDDFVRSCSRFRVGGDFGALSGIIMACQTLGVRVMLSEMDVKGLEARGEAIRRELASIGDLRPGSLFERYRKCGKPGCHCAREGDPGHGPNWVLTARVNGRPLTRAIPRKAVAQTRAQIDEYQRLRALTAELVEVSEGLCQARLSAGRGAGREVKKGASRQPSRRRSGARSSG